MFPTDLRNGGKGHHRHPALSLQSRETAIGAHRFLEAGAARDGTLRRVLCESGAARDGTLRRVLSTCCLLCVGGGRTTLVYWSALPRDLRVVVRVGCEWFVNHTSTIAGFDLAVWQVTSCGVRRRSAHKSRGSTSSAGVYSSFDCHDETFFIYEERLVVIKE